MQVGKQQGVPDLLPIHSIQLWIYMRSRKTGRAYTFPFFLSDHLTAGRDYYSTVGAIPRPSADSPLPCSRVPSMGIPLSEPLSLVFCTDSSL